ncbi:MAG: L-glutamate gamma-semialdehyde dehydrogenase [Fidelibacterota bacterium]
MNNAKVRVPPPANEPIKSYAPGTPERDALRSKLTELRSEEIEIPLIIGDREVRTGNVATCVMPHSHRHVLARYHQAGDREVHMAIETALDAWKGWSTTPWESRIAVFKRMAALLEGPYRFLLNAAAMLNLSKNVFQAEIDSACEMIDMWNFNARYAQELYEQQPPLSPPPTWNVVENRPLEGFVFAISPFNFVSIAGNLPTAPALMGNVILWKPAPNAVYPAYYLTRLFKEAGLPDGVINFIPGPAAQVGSQVLSDPHLAGVHFTGSTATFQTLWKTVSTHLETYRNYPRVVGETGGKNFCLVHESADRDALIAAMIRGAFEYQGQKCSAVSRAYIPIPLWKEIKDTYLDQVTSIKMGDVEDFANFMNAVIDEKAFKKITGYIEWARKSKECEFLTGGGYDDSEGYFVEPTTIVTTDPHSRIMEEEIFGPVVTLYLYDPNHWEETVHLVDQTSRYGLTGAVFARDRNAVDEASRILRHAAGNFYVNDKPTGAVVGQQPFGGSRRSGTNDKAGSMLNLSRWVTQRVIKENFDPPRGFRYPFMDPEVVNT